MYHLCELWESELHSLSLPGKHFDIWDIFPIYIFSLIRCRYHSYEKELYDKEKCMWKTTYKCIYKFFLFSHINCINSNSVCTTNVKKQKEQIRYNDFSWFFFSVFLHISCECCDKNQEYFHVGEFMSMFSVDEHKQHVCLARRLVLGIFPMVLPFYSLKQSHSVITWAWH